MSKELTYKHPYRILAKVAIVKGLKPPLSNHIEELIKNAQILYFPNQCPKCQREYRNEEPKMMLLKDPDEIVCWECGIERLGENLENKLRLF